MQISITFRHMEASQALRDYVDSKIGHMEKFLIKPTEVHVILSVEKYRHRAEIVLHEQNFKAAGDEVSDDMYKSIDSAISKIETQVKKHKQKLQNHHKHHQPLHEIAAQAEDQYQREIDRHGK